MPEIVKLIEDIDISKSSCVDKISITFSKCAMLSMLRVICHMCCSSLITGNIPIDWTNWYQLEEHVTYLVCEVVLNKKI